MSKLTFSQSHSANPNLMHELPVANAIPGRFPLNSFTCLSPVLLGDHSILLGNARPDDPLVLSSGYV